MKVRLALLRLSVSLGKPGAIGLVLALCLIPNAGHFLTSTAAAEDETSYQGRRSVLEFGAAGDGHANDTVAFQRALASGACEIVIPQGEFLLGPQPFVIPPRVRLCGAGTATVLRVAPGTETLFHVGQESRLERFRIAAKDGEQGGVEQGLVCLGTGSEEVHIDSVVFDDCNRVCILTDHAHGLHVRGCVFRNVGLAVNLVFSSRARLVDNRIESARIHGIQFWGNWRFERKDAEDILITGNHVKNGGDGAIWGAGATRVVIANNIVDGAEDVGIDLEWCDDSTISGNTVRNCKNAGISLFFACARVAITGNTILNDHPITESSDGWWVRSGIWLTPPNRGTYPEDHGHRDVTVVGNVIHCAEGPRRAVWIGPESQNIVIEANVTGGGEVRREDVPPSCPATEEQP